MKKSYAKKISQKKRLELAATIKSAIARHERLRNSYFWDDDFGNANARNRLAERYYLYIDFKYNGNRYTFETDISISRKNFYYKGLFYENGVRKDVRVFKKILAELTEAIEAYSVVNKTDATTDKIV